MAEVMVENYRKAEANNISKKELDDENKKFYENRQDICKRLGLNHQVNVVDHSAGIVSISKFYPQLNEEELKVWEWFCPGLYRESYDSFRNRRPRNRLSEYGFDTIPLKVLEEMEFAKSLRIFTELQIWTPERTKVDPILVGIADNNVYLIARWGESLKLFEEIKKLYAEFTRRTDKLKKLGERGDLYSSLFGLFSGIIIFLALFFFKLSVVANMIITALALAIVVGFIIFLIALKIIEKAQESHREFLRKHGDF